MCNGFGELTIMKTRTHVIKDKEQKPLLDDNKDKCPYCKGRGNIYVKTVPYNPLNPFKDTSDE